jgi:hypothetical protein
MHEHAKMSTKIKKAKKENKYAFETVTTQMFMQLM